MTSHAPGQRRSPQFREQRRGKLLPGHSCQAVTDNYGEMMDSWWVDWKYVGKTLLQCVALPSKNPTWSPGFERKAPHPKTAPDNISYSKEHTRHCKQLSFCNASCTNKNCVSLQPRKEHGNIRTIPTQPTQRVWRPPPIQELGAEHHTPQLNIYCSWWWAYVPETCRAKNTSIKLPCCIKLAFHFTAIPQLTKIIRSGITFVSRNVISRWFL